GHSNLERVLHCFYPCVACGRPPTLMNGLHNGGMKEYFPYESQVTYSCGNGLSLIGESSIYCTSDGVNMMWSGPAPQCKGKPEVENGRMMTTRQAFTYGVTVRFSCKEGYLLHGSRESQCQDDNTWNPPVPSCQPGARESKEFLLCDVPLTELRTLLELKKLYLEIQKLKREINKL
uniref:Sushi domain-containing protein n=1 Tax=Chelonoidis abingdonii TaxID=106734 RepID=A0A8C0G8C1_CHEAB